MIRRRRGRGVRSIGLLLAVSGSLVASGCDSDAVTRGTVEGPGPDARIQTHVVLPSTPTPEGLAYIEAIADVHARADAATGDRRVAILRGGLAMPVPARLGEAEVLRLELAARLAETLSRQPQGVPVALDVLVPMLRTDRSLPVDRATARALVVLGDIAAESGDDALAAGSYARSIRVMSLLRQELAP